MIGLCTSHGLAPGSTINIPVPVDAELKIDDTIHNPFLLLTHEYCSVLPPFSMGCVSPILGLTLRSAGFDMFWTHNQ